MNKQRRHFAGTEKVAILKRHLSTRSPSPTSAMNSTSTPTQFYGWLKEFFENGHAAFDNGRKAKAVEDAKDDKIEQLEAKLQRKNEVLAELMEEHTQLKKDLGETLTGCWVPHDTRDQHRRFRPLLGRQDRHPRLRASCPGSASAPASSTTGSNASARSTSTTPGCRATTGSPTTRRSASAPSPASIRSKAIAA